MILALVILVIGEVSLIFDLGNRLLGSYIRTPAKAFAKICMIVFACVLLAVPVFLVFIEAEPGSTQFLLYLSNFIGILIFLHFLFPYRFGIARIRQKRSSQCKRVLNSHVVLHDECVRVPSSAVGRGGLQFLVISDLHCNSQEKLNLIKSTFEEISDETFDAVLVLGDLSEDGRMLPGLIPIIAELPNRYGIFCVRGNHDFENGRQVLIEDLAKRHSINIISNTVSKIPEIGIELVGFEYPPDCNQIPKKSENAIRLGLTHTPDNIILFSRLGTDIVVAGHTHGGWFRLPALGTLFVPSGLGRFLNKGWFKRGRTLMYITSGLPYLADHKRQPEEMLRLTIKPNETKEGVAIVEEPAQ